MRLYLVNSGPRSIDGVAEGMSHPRALNRVIDQGERGFPHKTDGTGRRCQERRTDSYPSGRACGYAVAAQCGSVRGPTECHQPRHRSIPPSLPVSRLAVDKWSSSEANYPSRRACGNGSQNSRRRHAETAPRRLLSSLIVGLPSVVSSVSQSLY